MPRYAVYPQGASVSVPQLSRSGGGQRKDIRGWSKSAAARHRAWLQSVDPDNLPSGHAIAFTLTMRDTPADAVELHAMRRAWEMRARRLGAVAGHWVVELQRRGTPHLHGALWFSHDVSAAIRCSLIAAWVEICSKRDIFALPVCQYLLDIDDMGGWSRYCSKHSGRSQAHYQREGLPPGWEKSGRVWGHWGDGWVTRSESIGLDWEAWHDARRLLRAWARADARSEWDPVRRRKRLKALKRASKRITRPELSRVAPVREWVPESASRAILDWLVSGGAVLHFPLVDAPEQQSEGEP